MRRRYSAADRNNRDSCSFGGDSGGLGRDLMGPGLCPAIIAR
jgi:hypothetical protein